MRHMPRLQRGGDVEVIEMKALQERQPGRRIDLDLRGRDGSVGFGRVGGSCENSLRLKNCGSQVSSFSVGQ